VAGRQPFNIDNGCWSYTGREAYNIPESTEGVNELTQTMNMDGDFTIDELEVWKVAPI
jgi:hypothetical protein